MKPPPPLPPEDLRLLVLFATDLDLDFRLLVLRRDLRPDERLRLVLRFVLLLRRVLDLLATDNLVQFCLKVLEIRVLNVTEQLSENCLRCEAGKFFRRGR